MSATAGAYEEQAPLALVTGGHRRLGGRIAATLAAAGYKLALHGSHDVVLDAEVEQALRASGAHWHGFVADFEQVGATQHLMDEVTAHFGGAPDLLVNSAALFGQDRLATVTESDLTRHYRVNAAAPVLLTRAMMEAAARDDLRDRAIVNILDQRLVNPHGDQLAYTLAKQALAGFTRIAARELAGKGIRVNGVAPGLTIATEHYEGGQIARLAGMMPLGRLPQPAQVAEAVLYLARAGAVTGQVIMVDGGAHMESYSRDFLHL